MGTWTRLSADPILSPKGDAFESAGTFNPAVIKKDGKFVMLYRAQDRKGTSSLGYAKSDDGIHFTRRPEPVMVSEAPYEKGGGVEDPRLQKVGDTFYLTYTGYNNVDGAASGQERRPTMSRHVQGPDSLAAARCYHPEFQGQMECEVDEVGRHRSRQNQW